MIKTAHEPNEQNDFLLQHINTLNNSLKHWTGHTIMADMRLEIHPDRTAREIYHAPFALLSHGTDADPIINYANLAAQKLFEMSWIEFVQLPSRLSAEMMVQNERDALLKRVSDHGYIDDYSGVRISKTGQRFLINQATVWNLIGANGSAKGQAAMFADWQMLAD